MAARRRLQSRRWRWLRLRGWQRQRDGERASCWTSWALQRREQSARPVIRPLVGGGGAVRLEAHLAVVDDGRLIGVGGTLRAAARGSGECAGAARDRERGVDARAGTHGRGAVAVMGCRRERAGREREDGGLVHDVAGSVEAWGPVDDQVVLDGSLGCGKVVVKVAGGCCVTQEGVGRVRAGGRREVQVAHGELYGGGGGGRRGCDEEHGERDGQACGAMRYEGTIDWPGERMHVTPFRRVAGARRPPLETRANGNCRTRRMWRAAGGTGRAHHRGAVASIPRLTYLRATAERLNERNLRNLLDFVAEVEAAALIEESALRTLLVASLGRLVASDGVMLTGFDPRLERTVTTASDPRIPELRAREPALWASCLGHHPTVVAFGSTRGAGPLRFSDVLTPRAYRRLPIYEHFFRPCGVEHKLDVRLWPTERHVDVGCSRKRRDFDEQEREVVGALRPYLTVIFRRASCIAIASRLRELFDLTAREAAVLALVVRGHRAHDVARELGIAEGTARKHIERVYRKLGASTRTQAIARILR